MPRSLIPLFVVLLAGAACAGGAELRNSMVLTGTPVRAFGGAAKAFAINEPVWMSLELRNRGSRSVNLLLSGDEHGGVVCTPAAGYRGRVRFTPNRIAIDQLQEIKRTTIEPGHSATVEVLLADYFTASAEGVMPIECRLRAWDEDHHTLTFTTVVPVKFMPALTGSKARAVVRRLESVLASGDEPARIRAVKSALGLSASLAWGLLQKAISDRSEVVQMAALTVAPALEARGDERARFLGQAAKSDKQSVRERADEELRKVNRSGRE